MGVGVDDPLLVLVTTGVEPEVDRGGLTVVDDEEDDETGLDTVLDLLLDFLGGARLLADFRRDVEAKDELEEPEELAWERGKGGVKEGAEVEMTGSMRKRLQITWNVDGRAAGLNSVQK